jgi:hypothetical protein
MEVAGSFSGARGEGHLGWLFLLAAHDLNPLDPNTNDNLVANYVASNYSDIAMDSLSQVLSQHTASGRSDNDLLDALHNVPELRQMSDALQAQHGAAFESYMERRRPYQPDKEALALPPASTPADTAGAAGTAAAAGNTFSLRPPQLSLPFSTAVGSWRLFEQFPELRDLSGAFYDEIVSSYLKLKVPCSVCTLDRQHCHRCTSAHLASRFSPLRPCADSHPPPRSAPSPAPTP